MSVWVLVVVVWLQGHPTEPITSEAPRTFATEAACRSYGRALAAEVAADPIIRAETVGIVCVQQRET